jgi:hypothetical protein
VKLFNLELKNDDPMALASEIKAIMHDIDAIGVKIDIPLTAFNKALYPTYSHYLESLQASGQMKSITFDTLVEKVAKREKDFGKKSAQSIGENMHLAPKGKNQSHNSSRGEGSKRGRGRKNLKGRGVDTAKVRDLIFIVIVAERMGHMKQRHAESHGRRSKTNRIKKKTSKTSDLEKGKAPKSSHYIVAHCNVGVTEDLFNTSFASWTDAWLLDTGATCHMTFRRDFFEDFNYNVDGIVYFASKSSLKPSKIGTIGL